MVAQSNGTISLAAGGGKVTPRCTPVKVGVPKELKTHEYRVGLTPSSAFEYVNRGHQVFVQRSAGEGSGFLDSMYEAVNCKMVDTIEEVYRIADLIVKVKEPIPEEYNYVRRGQVLFTYFHFAANEELTRAMLKCGAICIAYETVQDAKTGRLPLLVPMSEIAGRLAVLEGAKCLQKPMGGMGIVLGGSPGVDRGRVVIVGGGVSGCCAAKVAAGLGADVVVMDINVDRLRQLEDILPANCQCLFSSRKNLELELPRADVVIGAALVPGAHSPVIVLKEDIRRMKRGSVIVDIAVDQGGCVETCKPTTFSSPTFVVDGVIHYCVANIPSAAPRTATEALNNATLRYGLMIADKGWKDACKLNPDLKKGLNIAYGKVTYAGVASAFDLPHDDVDLVLKSEDDGSSVGIVV